MGRIYNELYRRLKSTIVLIRVCIHNMYIDLDFDFRSHMLFDRCLVDISVFSLTCAWRIIT